MARTMTHDPISLPRLPPMADPLPPLFPPLPSSARSSISMHHPPNIPRQAAPSLTSPKTTHVLHAEKPVVHRAESFNLPPPPPRPTMRHSFSSAGPSGYSESLMLRTGEERESPEDDSRELEREELTTKGRKRKRLAKACSACHKNKRRCDGFAPCSNCEFSSRPCLYLNAQGEPIPPPRVREAGDRRMSRDDSKGMGSASKRDSTDSEWGRDALEDDRMDGRRASVMDRRVLSPIDVVERDPALSAELVELFLRRIQPHGAMFHIPTFQHRLYLGQTLPLLLDAMYAMAARMSDHPALLTAIPAKTPRHLRGEAFADRAHRGAKQILDSRASWSEEEKRLDRGTYEETEFVQSLYLLSVYYSCMRQTSLGLYFLDMAVNILHPTSVGLHPPAQHLNLPSVEYLTLLETRNRTFWMLVFQDLYASLTGRPRRIADHELGNIPLPGSEVHWLRFGGSAAGGREPGRRDGLSVGTGNWIGEEGQVGEFGHMIRMLSILSSIMGLVNDDNRSPDMRTAPLPQHEHALKSWALSLPRHLRFDETNLRAATAKLSSPVSEISMSGHIFGFMHAMAECGMFYLQAAVAQQPGAAYTAQRQNQAVDNIVIILNSFGEKGRESSAMLFPLLVATNWHDHIKSGNGIMQPLKHEEQVQGWWDEVYNTWGFERNTIISRGIYEETPRPFMPIPLGSAGLPPQHSHLYPPHSAQGMYPPPHSARPYPVLEHRDSRDARMSIDDRMRRQSLASSVSHATGHTPPRGYDRGPDPQTTPLPALGLSLYSASIKSDTSPRVPESAISTTSSMTLPTPRLSLPNNTERDAFRLPPPSLAPPLRPRGQSATFFLASPSPRLSISDSARGSTSAATVDREQIRTPREDLPADHPSARIRRPSEVGSEKSNGGDGPASASISAGARKASFTLPPLSAQKAYPPRGPDEDDRRERDRDRDDKREWGPLIGIAALVSAAEVRDKEREAGL